MTPTAGTAPGLILVTLLLAVPLLVLLPLRVMAAYQRALTRLMGQSVPPEPPPSTPLPAPIGPALLLDLHHRARTRQRRCALVYAVAGASAAASLTLALMGESGVHNPVAFLTIFAANLWPLLLALGTIFSWRPSRWRRAIAMYCAVPCLLALLQQARSSRVGLWGMLLLFVILNAPATLLFRAISFRKIRQIGPTLLPFCLATVLVPLALLHLAASQLSASGVITDLAIAFHLNGLVAVGLVVLLSILFALLTGWLATRVLVALYRYRWISDQSLLLDSLWALFIGTQALVMLTRTGDETGSGSTWTIAAFPLYLVVLRLGLALFLPRRSPVVATSLLVLRAFALQQRAEVLFQPTAALWRFLGPVSLIGGPDLAATTVSPGSLFEFVSGRLPALFIRSRQDFHARLPFRIPPPTRTGASASTTSSASHKPGNTPSPAFSRAATSSSPISAASARARAAAASGRFRRSPVVPASPAASSSSKAPTTTVACTRSSAPRAAILRPRAFSTCSVARHPSRFYSPASHPRLKATSVVV